MYKKSFQSILFMLILFVFTSDMFPCTSILVTKGASEKGAPMISYSCDGEFHPHLRITPAAKYKPGEMVEIRGWRGVLGKIPQVPETYKVIGLMNEFQLAIGETTFGGRKELISNKGIFHYYPLMRIALQRAKTAREAIIVMTTLVEKHGYRSEGESISIADKHEAWLLEIVGPGKDGIGAIWVAIKIPDGMVSATANMSRIHEFPLNDPGNVLYSENVISFAVKHGYYDPEKDGTFSFSKAYNPPTEEQIRYSSRRIWSIFRRISPSMNISSKYSNGNTNLKPYELYIKPDSKLNVRDVIALHRDHYENTKFDMTKDLVSGPFEAPDRWRPMKWKSGGKLYAWERPIATQQAGFVFVSESRAYVPDDIGGIVWFGMDNPYTNVFVPVYTSVTELPLSYTIGSLKKYTRDSAWWTFNFVANYANLRYSYMIKDIQKVQKEIEDLEFGLQPAIEHTAEYLLRTDKELAGKYLTKYCVENAEMIVRKWRDLGDLLVTKYNDGYIQNEKNRPQEIGYPDKWLKKEAKEKGKQHKLTVTRDGDKEL